MSYTTRAARPSDSSAVILDRRTKYPCFPTKVWETYQVFGDIVLTPQEEPGCTENEMAVSRKVLDGHCFVAKVVETCNNPEASAADVYWIISVDPDLVGRVMQLINSTYYGLGNQIISLARAFVVLGLNTIKNLTLESVPERSNHLSE